MKFFGYEIVIRRAGTPDKVSGPAVSCRENMMDLEPERILFSLFVKRGEPQLKLSRKGFYVSPRSCDLVPVIGWIIEHVASARREAVVQLYRQALTKKHIEANIKNRELERLRKLLEVEDG